jgi:hypothetical protein
MSGEHAPARGTSAPRATSHSKLWHKLVLALVLASFSLLVFSYSRSVPPFESPGEAKALALVQRDSAAASTMLSPLAGSANGTAAAPMPPLYGWVARLLTAWVPAGGRGPEFAPNLGAVLWQAEGQGNRNAFLHNGQRILPWRPQNLALLTLRALSWLCSLSTILSGYWFARLVSPSRPAIGLGTAAIIAFTPSFIFTSATAGPDALSILLTSVSLLAAAHVAVCREPANPVTSWLALRANWPSWARQPCTWRLVGMGALVGLTALQTTSGLLLWVPLVWSVALRGRHRPQTERRQLTWAALLALGCALALSGWWYGTHSQAIRVSTCWHALRPILSAFPWPLATFYQRWSVSYWALFGWGNIRAPAYVGTTLGALSLATLVGLTLLAARVRWKRGGLRRYAGHLVSLDALWVLLTFLGAVLLPSCEPWPAGHRMLAAIVPISLLLCVGISSWEHSRRFPWLATLTATGMIAVAALVPSAALEPAYRAPRIIAMADIPASASVVDIAFGESLFLVGYELGPTTPSPGGVVQLRLYWLSRQRTAVDYLVNIALINRDQRLLGSLRTHPGNGNLATSRWVPGDVIVDDHSVPIDATAAVPVAAQMRIALLASPGLEPLAAHDMTGKPLGLYPLLGHARITPRYAVEYRPSHETQVVFGDRIALEGYDRVSTVSPGQTLSVTCYWRSLVATPWNYTVFVHLLDASGHIVAQIDEQPVHGNYPTSYWQGGDRVRDPHFVALPSRTPPGTYTLRLGLYRLGTGNRLAITSGAPAESYALDIGPVQVLGSSYEN